MDYGEPSLFFVILFRVGFALDGVEPEE